MLLRQTAKHLVSRAITPELRQRLKGQRHGPTPGVVFDFSGFDMEAVFDPEGLRAVSARPVDPGGLGNVAALAALFRASGEEVGAALPLGEREKVSHG